MVLKRAFTYPVNLTYCYRRNDPIGIGAFAFDQPTGDCTHWRFDIQHLAQSIGDTVLYYLILHKLKSRMIQIAIN